jgi:hypothetical protein
VRFYDTNHLHDSEDQDTADLKRDFHGKTHDMIRERVMKNDQQFTVEAYNQQLIRHNKVYSKMASEFIANSEMMIQVFEKMPRHEIISEITKEISQIRSRFSLMEEQFGTY